MSAANWKTAVMFGVCIGCFISTWIALLINPAAPFMVTFFLGFVVLWRAGNEHAEWVKGGRK